MINIHILKPFNLRLGNKEYHFKEGSVHRLDPNNAEHWMEIQHFIDPSFPYRFFISVDDPLNILGGSYPGTPSTPGWGTCPPAPNPPGPPSPSPYPPSPPVPSPNPGPWPPSPGPNPQPWPPTSCESSCIKITSNPPTQPYSGQTYFDPNRSKMFIWTGQEWKDLGEILLSNSNGGGNGGDNSSFILPPVYGDIISNGVNNELNLAPGVITNQDISENASISINKLDKNPLDRLNHSGVQPSSSIYDFDVRVRSTRLDQFAVPEHSIYMNGNRITGLQDPCEEADATNKAYVDALISNINLCDTIGPTCDLDFQGFRITDLGDPKNKHDAVTKDYVDNALTSSIIKPSVKLVSTQPLTSLQGLQHVIDGTNLSNGDRVLIAGQSDPRQNGIYDVSSGPWIRSEDADQSHKLLNGSIVFVREGDNYKGTGWVLSSSFQILLGISSITFTQFTGLGKVSLGKGLYKENNNLHVGTTTGELIAYEDKIGIDPTWAGQTSINTVGKITTGTWCSTPIAIGAGGTGATNPALARENLSAASSGTNSDITALLGLTTPLDIRSGGTGACNPADARANLQAADCINGVSTCITQLPNFIGPLTVMQGGTGASEASIARFNLSAAKSGVNRDITSLEGLTTPLAIQFGGTGANEAEQALLNLNGVSDGLNLGNGSDLFRDITTIDSKRTMRFRSIEGGNGINTTQGNNSISIEVNESEIDISNTQGVLPIERGGTNATTSNAALTNLNGVSNAENRGGGSGNVYINKTGTQLNFRSIRSGGGCTISVVGDEIIISVP